MTWIGKTRRASYRVGRTLGDVQAVRRHRVVRRTVHKAIGRHLWRLWR